MIDWQTETADEVVETKTQGSLGIVDIGAFLLGSRAAIEKSMRCKRAWLLGALLVATAALCREYDAVSLLHQPSDLLAPFGASLVLSAVLFIWLHLMPCGIGTESLGNIEETTFAKDYVVFLTAYWLTAPLAWLYAIPVEAFLSEYDAAWANLVFLSAVSLWRIFMFARFVSVWRTTGYWTALNWMLVPCCAIAFVALMQRNMSIVGIMGGLRLSETEQMIVDYQTAVINAIGCVFPISVVGCILSFFLRRKSRRDGSEAAVCSVAWSGWLTPCVICVPLLAGAIAFQPPLQRARVVDRMLRNGKIESAIDLIDRAGSRDKFPIGWDPLPTGRDKSVTVMSLVGEFETEPAAVWAMDWLLQDADQLLLDEYVPPYMYGDLPRTEALSSLDPSEQQELLTSARRLAAVKTGNPLAEKARFELVELAEAAVKASPESAEQ